MAEGDEKQPAGTEEESKWRDRHWPLIRVLISAGFGFSCFGLLLFVWTTFGGFVPLHPKSYQFTADFSEGISLQTESDVRIGGVSVGKVKEVSLPPDGNATRATIELEPQFAPLSADARAILRNKTLLGETFVELTSGSKNPDQPGGLADAGSLLTSEVGNVDSLVGDDAADPIPEGGHLADSQVLESVQIDEIFNAFDEPTRNAFRVWQQQLAIGSAGRGLDLSDAFGNLGPFSQDAAKILKTLNNQQTSLSSLINNTGAVFEALTRRDAQLGQLIEGNNKTFGALASRDEALAETIRIFPTFNAETRKLLTRLQGFSVDARPLARDLKPVARNLTPTLKDVRALAPHAKSLFTNLDPLITAAETGFPSLRGTVRELRPVLDNLDPFLANLNPILRYAGAYSGNVTDFLADPETTQSGTLLPINPGQPAARHVFRQIGVISPESLSIYPTRLATNRGNNYLPPNSLGAPAVLSQGIRSFQHDCDNTGASGGLGSGQVTIDPPSNPPATPGLFPGTVNGSFPLSLTPAPGIGAFAPCVIAPGSQFGGGVVPYVPAD